jgi:hypothetical protein
VLRSLTIAGFLIAAAFFLARFTRPLTRPADRAPASPAHPG